MPSTAKPHRLIRTLLALAAFCLAGALKATAAPRVEIKDHRFYVDGEPFYVRAIGYAPWRPHQRPGTSYADTNRRWTDMDFARIKAAHFNTVRTWEPLEPEELALAKRHGLMVLQGIRLDPHQDFGNRHNLEASADIVQRAAEASREADNILGYLMMTDIDPAIVLDTGLEPTRQFFRRMKRTIQSLDPRPVAWEHATSTAFIDEDDSDFVAFQNYAFQPKALSHALGQAGVVRWLHDHYAKGRPFLITETGGYGVSEASETVHGGAGGLNEYDQSLKDLASLRATVEGHAQGAVLVSWIDRWYWPSDPDTHDNEPWEWTGVLAVATDSKKDSDGLPRQLYADSRDYNQVIPVEPKANHFYNAGERYPLEAFGSPATVAMRFRLNGDDWVRLRGSGKGLFTGFFTLPKLAKRRQRVSFQALDKDDSILAEKELSFVADVLPESITLSVRPQERRSRIPPLFLVSVRDRFDRPVAGRKVFFGCYYPVSGVEKSITTTTGMNGSAEVTCPAAGRSEDVFLYAAYGTDSPDQIRTGDMKIFTLAR